MIRKVTIPLVCLTVFLIHMQLYAQVPKEFSLEDARRFALENNHDVRSALLDIDIADKQRWEVTASGFPQVEVTARYQNLLDIPTQLIPGEIFGGEPGSKIPVKFGLPHNASYGVSVSQLLFSGSYFVGVQASNVYKQLSRQSYERTRLDIKATVTGSYYLVLVAEENRRILSETLENLKKSQYEIEEMYKEGFTEQADVKQLEISVNQLDNMLLTLEKQIDMARKLLKVQMGLPVEAEMVLSDSLEKFIPSVRVKEPLEMGFDPLQNLSMKAVQTQVELAQLSLRNEKTTFLPTVAAFASIQRDAQRDEFNLFDTEENWYPTTVVGLQMSWPIFSGGSKLFRVQKAKIELDQARVRRSQVKEGLNLQYNQARSALESAHERYRNAGKNRDLTRDVYEITREKFREGLISSLELTQAHNQYLNSEGAYLQALTDLLNAETELKKVLEIL